MTCEALPMNGTSTCWESARASFGLLVFGGLLFSVVVLMFTWPLVFDHFRRKGWL